MGTVTLYKEAGPALRMAEAAAQGKEERLSCSELKCSLSLYYSAVFLPFPHSPSCHTGAGQRQINAVLSYYTNCNETITPVRNAVFSRNTSVTSHRGFSILIQMAL